MFKSSVLMLALLLSSPALFSVFSGGMDLTTALIRFLIAVPVAAIMMAALRSVTGGYGKDARAARLKARLAEAAGERARV